MKIKGTFVTRNIAGDIVIVPIGETALDYNGMITTTSSGALLWEKLEKGVDNKSDLMQTLIDHYDVDEHTAAKDVDEFLAHLKNAGMLE